ncbi:hypothetical protein [Bacteroides fluxus]|uniref:hypothetical protein n=1 Tax=Bacteroides fluxus TaxID=626930 RepID=UPI002672B02D|nr:hypothetical protein [Bacteroides fluxus]
MENDRYTQGIIRNVKYNLIAGIILTIIATLANLMACSPEMTIEENEKPPHIVDDWPEATDTINIKPDSVRDMTHADSIRFGLLPPDD